MTPPSIVLHISDLHAGPPFVTAAAEDLVERAWVHKPDLVVISGDLVQRADSSRQWRMIREFIAKLPQPQLIVPGNHDVPLYNVINRVLRPMTTYQREIGVPLNPVIELPGAVIIGGVTAHGLTIDGGMLSKRQRRTLAELWSRYDDTRWKLMVLHHQLVNPPGYHHRATMRDSVGVAHLLEQWGVDVLLCGHIHVSHVGQTADSIPTLRHGTVICQSGTTTSRRGKSHERGAQSYNVLSISDTAIDITPYVYTAATAQFAPTAIYTVRRRNRRSVEQRSVDGVATSLDRIAE
jgi:3',5'-cyclic AMP phosphodiesterase CpdA